MTAAPLNSNLTIIVLIDALGWEVVKRTGFCRDLLPVSGPTDTVLGYSSAAIPSLLSGTPPSSHGAWAMYRYDPEKSPFKYLRLLPTLPQSLEWRARMVTRWITEKRKAIRGYYDLYEIPLNVLGYFDVAQRGDPYTPGGLKDESFFDRLVKDGIPFKVWTYKTPEADNFEALERSIDSDNAVLFLYTAELDELMHIVGTTDAAVDKKLRIYEEQIKHLLEVAKQSDRETRLFVFSDHGMTDVDNVVDLKKEVKSWGYRTGRDFLAFYDSTMARFWCDPKIKNDLIERLNAMGYGGVLTDTELEALGCRFEDNAYGEVIFLVDPGGLIVPSYMGKTPLAAMHGYHPDDPHSTGCFLTNDTKCPLPSSILDVKGIIARNVLENRQ